ncbi:MAG: hypothetical protein F6K40_15435 [Okeania sp. SIO3I5]|uniref:hypothetical protein n=1 Tax=Okeania sp. SIO3I5 TaxID=2607805 RepID=UPI0013BBE9DE|nr:hypothetical protein [Okeania sp. SIO3I5]NEQ37585.1 hypothetical protein [Okeania sp. SIO3I5]
MKQILSLTAAMVSAAVLASTVSITEASAISLRYLNGPGTQVVGIDGLEVEGVEYNVDFIFGSYNSIYDGTLNFQSQVAAERAVTEVMAALGSSNFTHYDPSFLFGDGFMDGFSIPYPTPPQYDDERDWLFITYDMMFWDLDDDRLLIGRHGVERDTVLSWRPYAKFSPASSEPEPIPEPSLILGCIALGGLMLGSQRKTKG